LTVDGNGNIAVADTGNFRVRVVAGSTGTFYGKLMTAGDIYTAAGGNPNGLIGDSRPATVGPLGPPYGATADAAGELVIADPGNNRIRVVAESPGTFYGVPMTPGQIYTVAGTGIHGYSGAGGPAIAAKINRADGVAVDAAGNLVLADTGNNRIRVVAAAT